MSGLQWHGIRWNIRNIMTELHIGLDIYVFLSQTEQRWVRRTMLAIRFEIKFT